MTEGKGAGVFLDSFRILGFGVRTDLRKSCGSRYCHGDFVSKVALWGGGGGGVFFIHLVLVSTDILF